jgi:hypothetical protein
LLIVYSQNFRQQHGVVGAYLPYAVAPCSEYGEFQREICAVVQIWWSSAKTGSLQVIGQKIDFGKFVYQMCTPLTLATHSESKVIRERDIGRSLCFQWEQHRLAQMTLTARGPTRWPASGVRHLAFQEEKLLGPGKPHTLLSSVCTSSPMQ